MDKSLSFVITCFNRYTEASKLGFGVVIGRSGNDSDRRVAFVTRRCERSETYKTPLWKFKRDDTGLKKC